MIERQRVYDAAANYASFETYKAAVVDDQDVHSAILIARYASQYGIHDMQQLVAEYGSCLDVVNFAKLVTGADVEILQRVIIARGSGLSAYLMAKDVPCTDIADMENVVIDRGKTDDIYRFARDIEGADITRLQRALINKVSYAESCYLRYFATDVPHADIQVLQQNVVTMGTLGEAYLFAQDVKTSNLKAIQAELERGDSVFLLTLFKENRDIQDRLKAQASGATRPKTH